MRIAWKHYGFSSAGLNRGYLASSEQIYEALRGIANIEDFENPLYQPQARVVVHYCPAFLFQPVRGKKNVLFSMWESERLPEDWLAPLAAADALVVPSRYCRQVWEDHGFEATVAPLGVDDSFRVCDSSRSPLFIEGRRRRFLWVGSRTRRKGWEIIGQAWRQAFTLGNPAVELYMKTIGDSGDQGIVRANPGCPVTIDKRDLSAADMLALYQSADVFFFPSFGEGFGLPALEAMAAGALVIAPSAGGLSEFISPETAIVLRQSETAVVDYGGTFQTKIPSTDDLAIVLRGSYEQFGSTALENVRVFGTLRARSFTWSKTAEILHDVCDGLAYKGLRAVSEPLITEAQ